MDFLQLLKINKEVFPILRHHFTNEKTRHTLRARMCKSQLIRNVYLECTKISWNSTLKPSTQLENGYKIWAIYIRRCKNGHLAYEKIFLVKKNLHIRITTWYDYTIRWLKFQKMIMSTVGMKAFFFIAADNCQVSG